MKKLWAKLKANRSPEKDVLDLIQGLIDVTGDLQHEANVLKRQVAELRLEVFGAESSAKPAAIVQMPRPEAAMKAKEN